MDGQGQILFTPRGGGVIHRVSARGGPVEAITALDAGRGENAHYWPVALPGGGSFLYFVRSTRPENNGIYLRSLDGKTPPVRLVTSLSSGLYAPPLESGNGHLLWVRDGELLAQPLDVAAARSPAMSGRSPPTCASRKASAATSRASRPTGRSSGRRRKRPISNSPGSIAAAASWRRCPSRGAR